jgi:NUC153 domain
VLQQYPYPPIVVRASADELCHSLDDWWSEHARGTARNQRAESKMSEPFTKRRKVRGHEKSSTAPTITDPRFANIQSDPRFQLPSKRRTHVKVDKRFSRILKDEDFTRRAKVDRYGRPVETDSERQRLKRRFEFDDDVEDVADNDTAVQRELQRVGQVRDPLREGALSGSSSEESSSEDEDEDESLDEAGLAGHLEGDVPMGEASSRLAVVNLDWDNIRSEDLMAVFSSFLPAGDRLLKVAIYPSEFGKERIEREEMEGPPEGIFSGRQKDSEESEPDSNSQDDEDEIKKSIIKVNEGEEFDSAKLRQYQLERLRYFYAVLTFSSTSAAKAIYDAVDGTEYLSTANFFDLRFIPDETDFSSDKPREECEKIPDGYKPNEFVTDALQHSKVKLTWDAEDVSRKEAQARAFRGGRQEIDENDLKAYLGTDSSDDEPEDPPATISVALSANVMSKKEKERQKMRALLGLGAEPVKSSKMEQGPVGDLQVTFSSGLSGGVENKASVFENEPEIEETTVEKYVRKERERKQKRKEKLKHTTETAPGATVADDIGNLGAGAKDAGGKAQDLGFDDPFFAAPENDKASASKMRKEERLKKRAEREAEEAANAAKRAELELLMVDDKDTEVRHFDMNEIEKAEKRAKKKGKHRKRDKSSMEGELVTDNFKLDTQDPRFAPRLFGNHEFAIDPTNPKFKGTAGMKALLDEGRKRRAKEDLDPEGKLRSKHQQPKPAARSVDEDDVRKLVEKVKRKKYS